MPTPAKTPQGLRLSAVVLGLALLLWIPFEDVNLNFILFFALAISSWWGVRLLLNVSHDPKRILLRHLLVGLLAGLAVTPLAIVLMAFKTGVHGHGIPDFNAAQIEAALWRTPIWVGGGVLIGLGSALWRLSRDERYLES